MTARAFDTSAVRFAADGLVPAVVQDPGDGRVLMVGYMDAEALAATLSTGEVHFHSRSRGTLWRKGETSGNVLRLIDLALDCDGDALLVTADPAGPTCHRGTRSCFDAVPRSAETAVGAPSATTAAATPAVATEASAAAGTAVAAVPIAAATNPGPAAQGFAWLETLWATIASRAAERPEGSYTTSLLAGGVDAVARKVTEEATEVLIAAKDDATAEAATEVAAAATASERPAARSGPSPDRAEPRAALAGETADLLYHALVLLAERDLPPADVIEVLRKRHR